LNNRVADRFAESPRRKEVISWTEANVHVDRYANTVVESNFESRKDAREFIRKKSNRAG